MRQPFLNFFQILLNVHICILHFKSELIGEVQHYSHWRTIVIRRRIGCVIWELLTYNIVKGSLF